MDDEVIIKHEGEEWVWDGDRLYNAKSFMEPIGSLRPTLNLILQEHLEGFDENIDDTKYLIAEATKASNNQQFKRAIKLAEKALEQSENNHTAATELSSALRQSGNSRRAVEVTERFRHSNSPALLTTRAAALTDIGEYEEAHSVIRRALAASRGGSKGPAFLVYNRLKKEAPELF